MANSLLSRLLLIAFVISSPPAVFSAEELADLIRPVVTEHHGEVAVAVKNLATKESYFFEADKPMATASLIKFPVMVEAYRQADGGKLDLEQLIELRQEDKVQGSGILTSHFSAGARLSLRDVVRLMIVYSDNTATNLVLDQIGIAATARCMEDLDLPVTRIHSKVFRRDSSAFPENSRKFGLGVTTARETVQLYEMLHEEKLVNEVASQQMLEHLLACDDSSKLARLLPQGTRLAHKSGAISNVRCDAGIIFTPAAPVAICVLTSANQDRSWGDKNEAELLCGRIALLVYDHFNPHSADLAKPQRELRNGDSGFLVEALQRTLNSRLDPSPQLSVDGEFGPLTESAVMKFQRLNSLEINGIVRAETWQTLGPLVTGDVPVADPDVVNSERLERKPADSLDGPPFTTCKAWCIGDARSGKSLWGSNEDKRLDFASTTKVMTGYLVLQQAASRPEILDEEITFSQTADRTIGSTAAVRAGEKLTVRELLYGLLLPSGNDASIALAEHFGQRFSSSTDTEPVAGFVSAMNRAAGELQMDSTTYKNPHGLTEAGHQSSAVDLMKLAYAAWQLPEFRKYVGTRQRGCTLVGLSGYERNVIWRNTNRLLPIDGYVGIKTGTTKAAGACLISSAKRNDRQLFVVVLGAQSSDARYVDTRNLYRWAWKQLGE